MKLLTKLLMVFSLVGCASIKRPDSELCVVNAPSQHLKCYNLLHDYDGQGRLKKSATAIFPPAKTVYDLNKGVWMSNLDFAELKLYIHDLKRAYEESKK
jgi:hypothetical protein